MSKNKTKIKSVLKWSGIGCLSMTVLLILVSILLAIFSEDEPTNNLNSNKIENDNTSIVEQNQKDPETIIKETIEQLEREINAIDEGIDTSNYRGTVESLQYEIVLFNVWSQLITENESHENHQIKELSKQLRLKVEKLQAKEFPIMRKEYARIVNKTMWENDIEVIATGKRSQYIKWIGGVFAANKNKKDFQDKVNEILKMLRFKQSRYLWHKYDNDYTSFKVFEGKDTDI